MLFEPSFFFVDKIICFDKGIEHCYSLVMVNNRGD